MNHPIIDFIKNNTGTLEEKLEKFKSNNNIVFKRHGNLLITKYTNEGKYGSLIERRCRGSIIDIENNNIVCPSIEGAINYSDFKSQVPFKYCAVEENIEGSLINVYFYNGRWNVSTKYNINADESRFRGKNTFRQQFDKLFDWSVIEPKLKTNFCYSFVLCDKENKMVTPISQNKLYHIETINRVSGEKLMIDIGIPHPKVIFIGNTNSGINTQLKTDLANYDDLDKAFEKLDYQQRGWMLYSLDRKFRCSLVNPRYQNVFDLIKNQSNIDYLCFESLFYKKNSKEILKYCPELATSFDNVKLQVESVLATIYHQYVNKYCYKQQVDINNKFGKSIKLINKEYQANRQRITRVMADDIILRQDCPYVYSMIFKH